LIKDTKTFILSHFDAIPADAFTELPFTSLYEFLSDDKLVCKSEAAVLHVVISYLAENKDLDQRHKRKLIDLLNYGLLNTDDLPLLRRLQIFIGQEYIDQIYNAIACYDRGGYKQPLMCTEYFTPRGHLTQILVLGGTSHNKKMVDTVSVIEATHISPMHTSKKPELSLPHALNSFACVSIGNFVFIIAGQISPKEITSDVHRYDIRKSEWLCLAKLPSKRYTHVAHLSMENIIVVGGADEKGAATATVYSYAIKNNIWSVNNPFPKKVVFAAICTGQDQVYVSGGCNSMARDRLFDSIYQYEPRGDVWLLIGHLSEPCCAHSMIYYNTKLFIAGGLIDESVSDLLQCYDIEANQCTSLMPLPSARMTSGCALLNEKIYIVAGYEGSDEIHDDSYTTLTDSILVYDILHNEWSEEEECKLPQPVRSMCCVVI